MKPSLVLGSGSPRRKELLERMGFRLLVMKPDIVEQPQPDETPAEYIARNCREKAAAVLNSPDCPLTAPVLTADTIVTCDGKLLEKPLDQNHARQMLHSLSGRSHQVMTAVAIARGALRQQFQVTTEVVFRQLSEREVDWYVATGEPMDKAGGYGIQGRAAGMVTALQGSYTNVVGLPLSEVLQCLAEHFDVHPPV